MSLRASAGYVGGRAAAGALSLFAMALLARGLGPEGYGWYALAATTTTFTDAVLLQPVTHALGRFLAQDAGVAAALARLVTWLSLILAVVELGAETALHLWRPGLAKLASAAFELVLQAVTAGFVYGLCMLAFDRAGSRTWLRDIWRQAPRAVGRKGHQ